MNQAMILRIYVFMFFLALVWVILGAPVFPAEWHDIPARLRLMLIHLPGRCMHILTYWR